MYHSVCKAPIVAASYVETKSPVYTSRYSPVQAIWVSAYYPRGKITCLHAQVFSPTTVQILGWMLTWAKSPVYTPRHSPTPTLSGGP